jgi:hypothetical protein
MLAAHALDERQDPFRHKMVRACGYAHAAVSSYHLRRLIDSLGRPA